MLSLLKKSEAGPAVQPSWHPDFRNQQSLPDIKAVRTTFWINGPAIFIVVALGIYFGIQEWQLHVLKMQITETEARIAKDKRVSDQAVALYKKFQVEEARVTEITTFIKTKPLVSALILRLAETIPANIAIDTADMRDIGLVLRLSVRGDAAAASGYATAYLEQLRADKELSMFEDFSFTNTPTRSPSTGRMAVEFLLRIKGAKKP